MQEAAGPQRPRFKGLSQEVLILPAVDTNRSWALALYEEASRQGDVEATFYLGRVHEGKGAVTKRNATKAAELYRKAVLMSPSERFTAAPLLVKHELSSLSFEQAGRFDERQQPLWKAAGSAGSFLPTCAGFS